jgi:hypothetical protein
MSLFNADGAIIEDEAPLSRDDKSVIDAAARLDAVSLGPQVQEQEEGEQQFEDTAEGYDEEDIVVQDDSAKGDKDDTHRSIEEATAAKEEGNK